MAFYDTDEQEKMKKDVIEEVVRIVKEYNKKYGDPYWVVFRDEGHLGSCAIEVWELDDYKDRRSEDYERELHG